jgi:Fic family protein
MAKANKSAELAEMTVAEKLKALYELQLVNTAIDKIRILRGELPLEVQDLEDEIEGLQTRVSNTMRILPAWKNPSTGKSRRLPMPRSSSRSMKSSRTM